MAAFLHHHCGVFISFCLDVTVVVQSLSPVVGLFDPMDCSTPGSRVLHISQSLLKFISTELVMPSNHVILYHPLLLLPSIFPSIRVFFNESALPIMWPKYWSFSFNISPSNEHPGLISFMMDWLDLLAVQGTLKSLLQHHSSKASILWSPVAYWTPSNLRDSSSCVIFFFCIFILFKGFSRKEYLSG